MTMHLCMLTLYTHNTHIHIHRVLDRRFIIGPGLCPSFLAKTAPERLTEGENFIGKVVVVGQAALNKLLWFARAMKTDVVPNNPIKVLVQHLQQPYETLLLEPAMNLLYKAWYNIMYVS